MAYISESTNDAKKETVQRNFYYYDIMPLKKNKEGRFEEESNKEETVYNAFEHIYSLFSGNGQEELIVDIDNGDRVYVIPDEVRRGAPIKFRIVLVRTNGFPLVEQGGELLSLTQFIESEFGLAEITHCVIFPEYGILGAEYNNSGARATVLREYIPRVTQDIEYLYCVPHIKQDVFEKIIKEKGLSLFQLEIKNTPETKCYIAETHSTFLFPFVRIPDNDTYEIVIKRKIGKKKKGFECPISISEMKALIQNCGADIRKFKISQGSIQNDAVDLLKQKVVHKSTVTRTSNKNIDSEDAYRILVNFFNQELKESLNKKE